MGGSDGGNRGGWVCVVTLGFTPTALQHQVEKRRDGKRRRTKEGEMIKKRKESTRTEVKEQGNGRGGEKKGGKKNGREGGRKEEGRE